MYYYRNGEYDVENNCISVIIPVYQAENSIRNCISSLQSQTYQNLQIITIDDGSTDQSPKILDEIAEKDKRVMVIHQKNQGVSVARNIGIEHATGKFILFVDADDTIDNKMCELLIDEYRREKSELIINGLVFLYKSKKASYWQTPTITPVSMSALAAVCWMLKNKEKGGIYFPDDIPDYGNIIKMAEKYISKTIYQTFTKTEVEKALHIDFADLQVKDIFV